VPLDDFRLWWSSWTPYADWRHPEGPHSNVGGRERRPVTHISYADANELAERELNHADPSGYWRVMASCALISGSIRWSWLSSPRSTPHELDGAGKGVSGARRVVVADRGAGVGGDVAGLVEREAIGDGPLHPAGPGRLVVYEQAGRAALAESAAVVRELAQYRVTSCGSG
jgi:hypothetical protein